jgi:hypothetical protein
MLINHHEKPLEEEEYIRANAAPDTNVDSSGKKVVEAIGFNQLARKVQIPTFS